MSINQTKKHSKNQIKLTSDLLSKYCNQLIAWIAIVENHCDKQAENRGVFLLI